LGLGSRVRFQTMDALRVLEFPLNSFDLVNQRFALSWLRTWEWTKLLLEDQRVCRPGGIIRIVEVNRQAESSSPALHKLHELLRVAMFHAGNLPEENGRLDQWLPITMEKHGIKEVQSRLHALTYRAGTEAATAFGLDMAIMFRVFFPFLNK